MVSRHPLLRYLAVMVLAVLLPCMSDAATPVVVIPQTYIAVAQIENLFDDFMNGNALNMIYSFSVTFSTVTNANTAIATLKQNYAAASTSQNEAQVTVGQISGFTGQVYLDMLNYIYSNAVGGKVDSLTLYYSSSSDAASATTNINDGYVSGVSSASMKSEVPNPTSPVNAVVVVKTDADISITQASTFLDTFRADDAHNSVSGLGARFKSSSDADDAVSLMKIAYPATGITRRSALEVGVSGLAGFNLNALVGIVTDVYLVDAIVTDVTLNFGSESAADAMVAKVNSGNAPGYASAEKQTSDDDSSFPVGGIVGIVVAVVIVGAAVAGVVYWKFFMSSRREVKDDNDDVLL